MKSLFPFSAILAGAFLISHAAEEKTVARPDGHAPISIMVDHTHGAGEWMLSYRYMFMNMNGLYEGDRAISQSDVFASSYIVSPQQMTMQMHMIGAMYAPTDRITLSAMLPYSMMEMDHLIAPGAAPLIALNGGETTFTTESSGIGDLKLNSLIRLVHEGPHHFHGAAGVSLPTGSIGETDGVPGPGGVIERQLPAAMQLGSGTIDLLPSLTYTYYASEWSAGLQASGILRTGKNAHGYRLGDRFELISWASRRICDWASVSSGLGYTWVGRMEGAQTDVLTNPPFAPTKRTVPTVFSENYGGQKIEALFGVNFVVPGGVLLNHRIAADLKVPLWQERNGRSLGSEYSLTLGWQYAF